MKKKIAHNVWHVRSPFSSARGGWRTCDVGGCFILYFLNIFFMEWIFCTIIICKTGKEFTCTVANRSKGSSPKDVWDGETWISLKTFEKRHPGDYHIVGYRDTFE